MFSLDTADYVFFAMSLGGCLLALLGWQQLRRNEFLEQHGIVVEGTVLSVEISITGSSRCRLVVQFLTPDHGWITGRHSVGDWPTRFKEGDAVKVRFDPEDPTSFTLLADGNSFEPWLHILGGAALLLAAVAVYLRS